MKVPKEICAYNFIVKIILLVFSEQNFDYMFRTEEQDDYTQIWLKICQST
jgi:hypothetical protein